MKHAACAVLMFAASTAADAAAGDYVRLTAGGVMTNGLQISIDLNTGLVTKREETRGSLASGEGPNWLESKRKLTAEELKTLTETIRSSLNEGFKSGACIEEAEVAKRNGKRPPIRIPTMDSITSLYVSLDGQVTTSPDRECETPAFDRVWMAIHDVAS